MKVEKKGVKAMIYNMSGQILTGKTTKKDIKEVIDLAKQHGLLPLVKQEFVDITSHLSL